MTFDLPRSCGGMGFMCFRIFLLAKIALQVRMSLNLSTTRSGHYVVPDEFGYFTARGPGRVRLPCWCRGAAHGPMLVPGSSPRPHAGAGEQPTAPCWCRGAAHGPMSVGVFVWQRACVQAAFAEW
jgi:hypothetical protein